MDTQEQIGKLSPGVGLDDQTPREPDVYDDIEAALPSFFTRAKAVECLNGLFTLNSLNHLTTRPEGPPVHYVGRKMVLRRDEFMAWLRKYNRRLYGDDAEGDGKGVRRPSHKKNGVGEAGRGNQEGQRVGTQEPNPLGDVFGGLEDC